MALARSSDLPAGCWRWPARVTTRPHGRDPSGSARRRCRDGPPRRRHATSALRPGRGRHVPPARAVSGLGVAAPLAARAKLRNSCGGGARLPPPPAVQRPCSPARLGGGGIHGQVGVASTHEVVAVALPVQRWAAEPARQERDELVAVEGEVVVVECSDPCGVRPVVHVVVEAVHQADDGLVSTDGLVGAHGVTAGSTAGVVSGRSPPAAVRRSSPGACRRRRGLRGRRRARSSDARARSVRRWRRG